MSISQIYSAQTNLLDASIVTIEVDLSKGLHSFSIVGLAGKAVDESKDRVSSAIKNTGFTSPKSKNQKVVVALAPADVKKEGPAFDLGIAIGYLYASGDITADMKTVVCIGELSLDGSIRKVKGLIPMLIEAQKRGFESCIIPKENSTEASVITGITLYPAESLREVIAHIHTNSHGEKWPGIEHVEIKALEVSAPSASTSKNDVDMQDIVGQETAKRALEIAAAGGHNIIMYGPPGTGKTMLAKACKGLLPALSFDDMLEVTSIHSIHTGGGDLVTSAPFRSPHHTASYVSIVGGGTNPRPGEVTLAHRGVLFLDEMPEFSTQVLETLREPLEERKVRISRAKGSVVYPASFILVGAMNPCPCGFYGVKGKECICSPIHIQKYKRKLSGPIADRVDLWVEVSTVLHERLTEKGTGESTQTIKERVQRARNTQQKRYAEKGIALNSELSGKQLVEMVHLRADAKEILQTAAKKHDLSARSYHRIIKTAQTIADLAGSTDITQDHILEALQYRPKAYQII
ncbi:MAG: YifB family Mg chelatase-like AAA ATPase [Candidatus Zambryskibacteria bacterium]|nr:YifB family Mg chelatase-like AAA ATPase [Candidatus Zambryskibacteria bacterium]